ncbi:MAG: glycosyltransferase [Polyangiales bacterium]
MRILQISKADAAGGGASRMAEELTAGLGALGHDVVHLVGSGSTSEAARRHHLLGSFETRIVRARRKLRKHVGLIDVVPFELAPLFADHDVRSYDVVHFHDLSTAVSPLTLVALAKLVPVVFTLHDCSAFTGGCIYPMGCERYRAHCGRCPQLDEFPLNTAHRDFTPLYLGLRRMLHRSTVTCVAPSEWMADSALASGNLERRPLVLSNGIDLDLFRPRPEEEVRAELGLPAGRRIVVVSAGALDEERKGARHAAAALRAIRDLDPLVVVVGHTRGSFVAALDGLETRSTGYLRDAEALASHYNAADVMLFSSLADNQPLTVMESLAVGTPVVGFATGGVPEMIVEGEQGFLVPPRDDAALASALRTFFERRDRPWSANARRHAEAHFGRERCARAHAELYRTLADGREGPVHP